MKFRAALYDQQLMKEFVNIVQTLSKLTKECVMNIGPEKLIFILNEESTSSAPLVWTMIDNKIYFDTFKMEGYDENYTSIFLSLNPANLARSLSVITRGPVTFVKMSLTNRNFPCITIEIELPAANSLQNRRIVHDVPVNVLARQDWNLYNIPQMPEPQIILAMPSLRFLRNLIEKVKNLSPTITFCASARGELSIIAESDSSTVASHYRNLEIKKIYREQLLTNRDTNAAKEIEVACLIDCKKTAVFLSALQMNNVQLSCGIVQDHFIQMEMEIRRGMLMTCIIPAVCI